MFYFWWLQRIGRNRLLGLRWSMLSSKTTRDSGFIRLSSVWVSRQRLSFQLPTRMPSNWESGAKLTIPVATPQVMATNSDIQEESPMLKTKFSIDMNMVFSNTLKLPATYNWVLLTDQEDNQTTWEQTGSPTWGNPEGQHHLTWVNVHLSKLSHTTKLK